jgi:dTDP-glucose 4,6-dehydratase
MNWKGKRVLVTGAGGFIGSHLAERLVELGAQTRGLVHYRSDGSWGWLDQSKFKEDMEVVAGDVRDRDSVVKALEGREVVFHLAALIGIPYSYHAPLSYVHTNIEGTLNILQASRDVKVERLVHTSTSEVYGTACYIPIDEHHPLQGQSPYSASKIAADKLAEAFHMSFGLQVATIRPFNTYGPRQSARAVIPTIISQALTGPAVHLGSLEPTRDFNYVSDTVDGFILVAASPGAVGNVTNIGTGQQVSIGDLARTILALLDRQDLPIIQDSGRVRPVESEVGILCADNRRASEILGWRPHYTLEEGLIKTIEWVRNHLERYRQGVHVV